MCLQCWSLIVCADPKAALNRCQAGWLWVTNPVRRRRYCILASSRMTTRQAGSRPLQIEIMDSDMVEFGIDLVHELDRNYGFPPKRTMSQVHQDSRLRSCQLVSVAVPLPLGL